MGSVHHLQKEKTRHEFSYLVPNSVITEKFLGDRNMTSLILEIKRTIDTKKGLDYEEENHK